MGRTIEVTGISDELLSQLDKRANQIGVDRSSYLRRLIERAVAPPSSWSYLSELLAPVHDYTEAHGISENEIGQFFVEELAATRRKNQQS
jgi:hypothetical protein